MFIGGDCNTTCSGNGICVNGTCQCFEGYKGVDCKHLDCPHEPDCNGRGVCERSGGVSACICNSGFAGDNCTEFVCPPKPPSVACNGNGWYLLSLMYEKYCLLSGK